MNPLSSSLFYLVYLLLGINWGKNEQLDYLETDFGAFLLKNV